MADETATTGNDDLLRRCIDVFLNASPMVLDGEKVPGYVTVHVTEEFRDEIVNAQLDSGSSMGAETNQAHRSRSGWQERSLEHGPLGQDPRDQEAQEER